MSTAKDLLAGQREAKLGELSKQLNDLDAKFMGFAQETRNVVVGLGRRLQALEQRVKEAEQRGPKLWVPGEK